MSKEAKKDEVAKKEELKNPVELMQDAKKLVDVENPDPAVSLTSPPQVKDFPKVAERKNKGKVADKDKPVLKWLCYITGGVDSAFLIANQMRPVDFDDSYKIDVTGVCLKTKDAGNKDQVSACKYICDQLGAHFVTLEGGDKLEDAYDPNVYGLELFQYAEANGINRIALNFNNDELNMMPECNQSIINGLNQQCIESNSQVRFHAPISGQEKGIIIKSVHEILGLDLKKLYYSPIKGEKKDKIRAYMRVVGFATAGIEDPHKSKYEKLIA